MIRSMGNETFYVVVSDHKVSVTTKHGELLIEMDDDDILRIYPNFMGDCEITADDEKWVVTQNA